jgi:O-antigen/teichoic acid export membrane protein
VVRQVDGLTMGIIQRQGLKNAISTYLGILLGFINLIVIQPYFLTPEEIGLTRLLFSVSFLISLFLPLGVTNLTVKYFPLFRDNQNGHNGFFGFMLLFPCIGFIIVSALLYLFKDFIIAQYIQESRLFTEYFYFLFPFTFILGLITVLNNYAYSLFKTTVPTFLNDVVTRLLSIVLFSIYFLKLLSLYQMVICFVLIYGVQLFFLLAYIFKVDKPKFKFDLAFIKNRNLNEMIFYSSLLSFASFASLGIKYMDAVFIGKYLPLGFVGIYSIAAFIPNVIEAPLNALERITMAKISHALAINNLNEIKDIYYKSVKYVLLIGCLLFIGITTNIKDLLTFLPSDYYQGYKVIYIISLSAILNMAAGGSASIIFNSDKYKLGVILLIGLSISAMIFNIIFIPIYGMEGAAFATLISLALYSLLRIYLVWYYYKLNPFNRDVLKIFILSISVFFIAYFLPVPDNAFLAIIFRSILSTVLYIYIVIKLGLVKELYNSIPFLIKL